MKHFQNAGKRLSLRLIIWHFGTAKNYNSNPMAEVPMVDDERMLREGLEMALHGEGFEVRTDRDGDEALKKIAKKRLNLILLDVMMLRMNGFRTCEEIRRCGSHSASAKDAEADQVRGIGLGADDYVSKDSVDMVMLARLLRACRSLKTLHIRVLDSSHSVPHFVPHLHGVKW